MQECVVTNMLRHWKELISVLKDEPLNKYIGDKLEFHTFVYKFRVVLDISGLSKEVVNTWCDDITTGCIARNMMSLPVKQCDKIPGVIIDTQSFIEIVKANNEQQFCCLYQEFVKSNFHNLTFLFQVNTTES